MRWAFNIFHIFYVEVNSNKIFHARLQVSMDDLLRLVYKLYILIQANL
jgi:hypothetical protein